MNRSLKNFMFSGTQIPQRERETDTSFFLWDEEFQESNKIYNNLNISYLPNIEKAYNDTLIIEVRQKYDEDKEKYPHLIQDNEELADQYFERTLEKLRQLKPKKIILSLIDAESIYFRFYNDDNARTHLEIFYTRDDDDDDIEAVATVYKRDEPVLKTFGPMDKVFDKLEKELIDKYKFNATTTYAEQQRSF